MPVLGASLARFRLSRTLPKLSKLKQWRSLWTSKRMKTRKQVEDNLNANYLPSYEAPESTMIKPYPALPEDIERLILETVAQDRQQAVKLALICRRVKLWIDLIIYEVVMLWNIDIAHSFLRTVEEKSPEFFAKHVKCLCIPYNVTIAEATRLLSVCTGLNSLACWILPGDANEYTLSQRVPYVTPGMSDITSLVTSLHLRSLCARLCIFSEESNPDFNSPLYHNITHLDIADGWETWMTWSWSGIGTLTHLSHLSLRWEGKCVSHDALKFLSHCKSLRVCIFYMSGPLSQCEGKLGDDPRLVVFPYTSGSGHWENRVRGEAHDFERAERIVLERQQAAFLDL